MRLSWVSGMSKSVAGWLTRILALVSALGYIGSGLLLLALFTKDDTVPGTNIPLSNSLEGSEALVISLFLMAGLLMLSGTIIWRGRKAGALLVSAWLLMMILVLLSILSYGFVFAIFLFMGIPAAIHGVIIALDQPGETIRE